MNSILLFVLGIGLFLGAAAACAEPRVTGYDRRVVMPGDYVILQGTDFPPAGLNKLKYGNRTASFGVPDSIGPVAAPIGELPRFGVDEQSFWEDTEIGVHLPEWLTPGTYWIAIYDDHDRALSNQLLSLQVRPLDRRRVPWVKNVGITLRATTVRMRLEAADAWYCGVDRRGFAVSPRATVGRIRIGHSVDYDPGGGWFPCWTWDQTTLQGAVMFDPAILNDRDRGRPSRIELVFERIPDSPDCGSPLVRAATADWTGGVNTVTSHTASVPLAYDSYIQEGRRSTVNLTRAVRALLDGGGVFRGFVLTTAEVLSPTGLRAWRHAYERTDIHSAGPYGCLAEYGHFRLRLSW